MSQTTPQTITIDGVTLTLLVERKRVKNINARLRATTLSISAPLNTPQSTLDQVNPEEDALSLARKVAARFPNKPEVAEVLFVTTQEARWGSYSPATQTIRL